MKQLANAAHDASGRPEKVALRARCPVFLVLDTSHSMWGQGRLELTRSLQPFCTVVGKTDFPGVLIDIAAIRLGDGLGMLEDFTPLAQSTLPTLNIRPKGGTPLGAALTLTLHKLEEQTTRYRRHHITWLTPQLILLSDGKSTDNFDAVADRIRMLVQSNRLLCHAVALGPSPDLSVLSRIAGDNVRRPLAGCQREAFSHLGNRIATHCQNYTQQIWLNPSMADINHMENH